MAGALKPKTAIELKHEEASKHAKSLTALRRHQKTPEGIKQAADSAAWSETCRRQWMALEFSRAEIKKLLPREPILICTGGRTFAEQFDVAGKEIKSKDLAMAERMALAWVLDTIKPSILITGGAHGADRWCAIWGVRRGIPSIVEMADWSAGHMAGPIRNQKMIDDHSPTAGVVFEGGAGTKDCWNRMLRSNIPVYVASLVPARDISP